MKLPIGGVKPRLLFKANPLNYIMNNKKTVKIIQFYLIYNFVYLKN